MNEKSTADKVLEITAFAESVTDPVFRQSLMLIADAMALATKFKRMDMAFLQMRGPANLPKFALLTYDAYVAGLLCQIQHPQGYTWAPDSYVPTRVLEEGSFQGVLRGESAGENPLACSFGFRFVFAYGIP